MLISAVDVYNKSSTCGRCDAIYTITLEECYAFFLGLKLLEATFGMLVDVMSESYEGGKVYLVHVLQVIEVQGWVVFFHICILI